MIRRLTLCLIFILFIFSAAEEDNGLIAWWNFDEENQTVKDSGPHGIHGQIKGNVERVEGIQNTALSFPGEMDSHVVFEDKEPLHLEDSFTLSAWVYRDNTGTRWDGIIINGGSQRGYQLFYAENNQKLTLYIHTDETPYHPVVGDHIPMYEWMHIAVTYNGKEVRLFQNGNLTASQECTGKVTGFPDTFYLGSAERPFNAFRGSLDEVKIFNRPLSKNEINKLYEDSAPADHQPSEEVKPAFEELEALRTPEGIKFSFQATDEFTQAQENNDEETRLHIYRNASRRNDENPGVKGGEKLFSGNLEPDEEGVYEYLDTKPVSDGYSYYYWVTPDGKNFRVYPAKVRMYHPEVWWSLETIEEKQTELIEMYPDLIETEKFGETVEGRPLEALLAGNQEKMIAFIGAVHVSESGPELILGALKKILKESPELVEKVGIAAIPCVTLDERKRKLETGYPRYLRKNAAGVDINRNFPAHWEELPPEGTPQTDDPDAEIYRGPEPASEPETQAIMAFTEETDPWASFFFHSLGSICSAGFVTSQYADSEGDQKYLELVEKVGRIYAEAMYGDDYTEYYWHHHTSRQGSHNVWMHKELRTPALSLELDSYEKGQVVYYDGATPELIETYQEKHKNAMKAVINAILEGEIQRLEPTEQ